MNDVKYADKTVEELEKRIAEVYAQAEKEIQEKLDNHLAKFAEKDEKKRAQLKAGEITKGEYTSWRQGQIATGKRWADLRDEMAKDLTNADILAMSISKGTLPDVFAHSHNYGTYQIESQGANTSYTLYDKSTVMRLISENPKLLPDPKVDIPKDLRWNKQHISNAVTQGILQGESISNLSKRLQRVTEMDKNSAMRNARTMVTSAQNAGRLESMKRAEGMGIPLLKQWLSAHDKRVRKSHQHLDGQEVPVREEFSNGLMYPGDPDGDPEEVYNCRCTLLSDVDVENLTDSSLKSDIYEDTDYEEWTEMHEPVNSLSDAENFQSALLSAKSTNLPEDQWRVDDTHALHDYLNDTLLITPNGSTIAVEPNGNIISVCKNVESDDRGSELLKLALEAGGDRLDAFGEGLYQFYTKNGFEPVSWTKFDKNYAPHDWVEGRDKEEPVIFYKHTGNQTSLTYAEFLMSTPASTDYGEAEDRRNKDIK